MGIGCIGVGFVGLWALISVCVGVSCVGVGYGCGRGSTN